MRNSLQHPWNTGRRRPCPVPACPPTYELPYELLACHVDVDALVRRLCSEADSRQMATTVREADAVVLHYIR
jgi:hypothetical protein